MVARSKGGDKPRSYKNRGREVSKKNKKRRNRHSGSSNHCDCTVGGIPCSKPPVKDKRFCCWCEAGVHIYHQAPVPTKKIR